MSSFHHKLLPVDSLSSATTHYEEDDFHNFFVIAGGKRTMISECENKIWDQFYYAHLPDSAYGFLLSALLVLPSGVTRKHLLHGGPTGAGPQAMIECASCLRLCNSQAGLLLVQVLERLQLPPPDFQAIGLAPVLEVLCKPGHDELGVKARNLLDKMHTAAKQVCTTSWLVPAHSVVGK